MKHLITQIFEIENKIKATDYPLFKRNFERIYHELEQQGYLVINPIGRRYDERDVAIEANILNKNADELKITKVLKPIIYQQEENGDKLLVQKAVVIAE